MRWNKSLVQRKSVFFSYWALRIFVCLFSFSITVSALAQDEKGEGKGPEEKFSYLIGNGSKMIRENDFERVFGIIRGLPQEKKTEFRIRVIENFAYLKGYLVVKKNEYGKKWEVDYTPLLYTGNKIATSILVDLLKDNNPYMRAFTARALSYLGDHSALEELRRMAGQDENSRVRSRAKEAYYMISGKNLPEGGQ